MLRVLVATVARSLAPAVVALSSLSACVDTSPDRVKLSARIEGVDLEIASSVLAAALTGGFDLVLEVGDLASDEATIAEPPSVELVSADTDGSLFSIDATPSGEGFPVTLQANEARTLAFTLTDGNELPTDDVSAVCAGNVQVAVTYRDSLADRPSLVVSNPVSVVGCP